MKEEDDGSSVFDFMLKKYLNDNHIEKMFRKTVREINKIEQRLQQSQNQPSLASGTLFDSLDELVDERENTQSSSKYFPSYPDTQSSIFTLNSPKTRNNRR